MILYHFPKQSALITNSNSRRKGIIMTTLKSQVTALVNKVSNFEQDEDGIESIQVVMILAFGAVVMVAAWAFWDQIKGWATGLIGQILGKG